ncbi:MAG: cysteine desulfurase [Crocinitomicaceae bacterium]|nr:cysteine desulfurase [Crocinitomicaceae bacterium]|tara:strand:- start:846 stop:1976 length:1131 start_codon:yes stop_codon:yes gene_type:complete
MNVYLDNAATTAVAPEVLEAMIPVLRESYGNPSSSHAIGRKTRVIIEQSRRLIAQHLNCHSSCIYFTSGGTEADNLALRGAVRDLGCERIITSEAEHSAVIKTARSLERSHGIQLDLVKHHEDGTVDLDHLEELLVSGPKTIVSIMHANNEVAVVQDIHAIGSLCRDANALFHSDTVQTMCHYTFDLESLPVDFIACSAHKFHGPKGVGFLYIRKGIHLGGQIEGGSQERAVRGGTESTHNIVGLAAAFDLAYAELEEHERHIRHLKAKMAKGLKLLFPDVRFNGQSDEESRLYTVLNVSFPPHPKSGMALFLLDLEGVSCSGGSACSSGATLGSHVLRSLKFHDPERASLRFSFGRFSTDRDIDIALKAIERVFA